MKKSSRDFLAGADLGESPVALRVEIDLERLLVRPHIHLRVHGFKRWRHLERSRGIPSSFVAAVAGRGRQPGLQSNRLYRFGCDPAALIVWQHRVIPVTALLQNDDLTSGRQYQHASGSVGRGDSRFRILGDYDAAPLPAMPFSNFQAPTHNHR